MHLANSRNECCKRSDDRDELCVDDRLSPVTFVKGVCAVKILPPEYLRVTPEQPIADRGSKKKANPISSDRRGRQKSDDHADLQLARTRDDPNRKQQRIAGKKEAYEQTALSEHNEEEKQVRDPDMRVIRDELP